MQSKHPHPRSILRHPSQPQRSLRPSYLPIRRLYPGRRGKTKLALLAQRAAHPRPPNRGLAERAAAESGSAPGRPAARIDCDASSRRRESAAPSALGLPPAANHGKCEILNVARCSSLTGFPPAGRCAVLTGERHLRGHFPIGPRIDSSVEWTRRMQRGDRFRRKLAGGWASNENATIQDVKKYRLGMRGGG